MNIWKSLNIKIPAGTLVRVSLVRWWRHEGENKCFLQLSGWYGLPEKESKFKTDDYEDDNLPF